MEPFLWIMAEAFFWISGISLLAYFGKEAFATNAKNGWLMAGILLLTVVIAPIPAVMRAEKGLKSYFFFLRISFSFLLFLVFLFTLFKLL